MKVLQFKDQEEINRKSALEILDRIRSEIEKAPKFVNMIMMVVTADEDGVVYHLEHTQDDWLRLHGAASRLQRWIHNNHEVGIRSEQLEDID